jgi:hypothetical protein
MACRAHSETTESRSSKTRDLASSFPFEAPLTSSTVIATISQDLISWSGHNALVETTYSKHAKNGIETDRYLMRQKRTLRMICCDRLFHAGGDMDGLDEKEIGGVLTVALNRHLITKLVHLGVISVEDADRVFDKTAESLNARSASYSTKNWKLQLSCANLRKAFEKSASR